ncbi:hypothetical protein KKG05_01215 [bacterium]|nr:hypothetical protein [bacterium]
MLRELDKWLQSSKGRVLVLGELQESLAFERAYKELAGQSLTEMLIPRFAEQEKTQLLFLSKSVEIKYAKKLIPTDRVIFSWSVNSETAANRWEKGAPRPSKRFEAAEEMKKLGWTIRFRLDPMIPYKGWQEDYAETIERINSIAPEMVTLGTIRASNTLVAHTKRNGRNTSVFRFLKEKDPSDFKWRIPYEQQLELYKFALDRLNPSINISLCKEDKKLWTDLGMKFSGCNCLMNLHKEAPLELPKRLPYSSHQTQIHLNPPAMAAKSRD